MSTYAISSLQLPWSITNEDELFKKILRGCFIIFLVFSLPVSFWKLPEPTRAEKEQLPPQLARIMLEKQELPKPPEPKPEEKKPEEKKPEEKKPDEKKPVDKTQDKIDNQVKDDKKALDKARDKAANSGLMQLKDDLMDMRESLQADKVASASADTLAGTQATQVERSGVFNTVSRGSGGIAAGNYSRDTGGVALSGRETTKVKSGLAENAKRAATAGSDGGNSNGQGGAARSEEEIRKVIEQNKGIIFSTYNKALKENAALQGKFVVKMVIDPSGHIIDISIVVSELNDPELEAKLLQKIKLISFPASNVERTTLNYTFNFIPQ